MLIRKFKVDGIPTEKECQRMSFGQLIPHLRALEEFKAKAKSTYLSQKRQSYTKAIRDAIKLYGARQYYCQFNAGTDCHDDSFQFWYAS